MRRAVFPLLALVVTARCAESWLYSSPWVYSLNAANEATILHYDGPAGAVTIPSAINGYPVKTLGGSKGNDYGSWVFTLPQFGNPTTNVTSVTIPNGVTTISQQAFHYCNGLTNVIIPNTVTSIEAGAFDNCHVLTNVTIPNSVTSIGDRAFDKCFSLTSIHVEASNPSYSSIDGVLFDKGVTALIRYPAPKRGHYNIPESVTSIEGFAFADSASLTSVTIPNGVTNIGEAAFQGCTALTSVTIPNGVTSIGRFAFADSASLTRVSIGNGVTNIGYGAFKSCTGLESLVIGRSVSYIDHYAFYDCTALTSVLFLTNPPRMGELSFSVGAMSGPPQSMIFYLPSTEGWGASFSGRPTQRFVPRAHSPSLAPATGFKFSWSGTGSVPMHVLRADSLGGSWSVVSSNNVTGQFIDSTPPSGQAFYRASLP